MKQLFVIQHTSAEYLGLMEDHFEGRRIRFNYCRPFVKITSIPAPEKIAEGLVILGGGPWGTAGGRDVPNLQQEVDLAKYCLEHNKPVIGIGLGAQILAIAAGGSTESTDFTSAVTQAYRCEDSALHGFLPETYPLITYMRDKPVLPPDALILSKTSEGEVALFQIGSNSFGFVGHPGIKPAMIEDLVMEFEESPDNSGETIDALRFQVKNVEDSLVLIMTGLIQATALMD
ncbi:MAG: hypothetical protein COA74_03060 [Gammaproteobacteria bacterium]|nr:MAG: hypothetical protein COA74_03060 [Gammaproteobacteria bacterium]